MNVNILINFLEENNFKLIDNLEDTNLTFKKYVDGIEFIYLLISPHKGTKNRIMFRADPIETHDRWSNCDYQRFYKDEEDFMKNWNRYLIFDEKECN